MSNLTSSRTSPLGGPPHTCGVPTPDRSLVVIGAGPKAIALAAKSKVLRDVGFEVPSIVAVERGGTAANWRAGQGWTDGRQHLGTLPEKDLGFPYDSATWGSRHDPLVGEITQRMAGFSWPRYLMSTTAYARWIDRGRPQPTHQAWADYLDWAANEAGLRVVTGEVRTAEMEGGGWTVTYGDRNTRGTVHGCGLLVSGPGPCAGAVATDDDRVLDTAAFWQVSMKGLPDRVRRVAVIGAGETAGTVVRELALANNHDVMVIVPNATLYSRGESAFENRYFSDPTGWATLTESDRREFIRRTDRAVFSQDIQRALAATERVSWRTGRVTGIRVADGRTIEVAFDYAGQRNVIEADMVVDATGGDPLWFTDLLGSRARQALADAVGGTLTRDALERAITHALSVSGLPAPLHLPNLAALAQGPGFPNLSALGLLADRVLSSYVPPASPTDISADACAATTRVPVPTMSRRGAA
ncbi:SidA/IucD/PvdA family monooxygenase [Streptomyces sp. HSG2]|uniref:SidA/IucD/PvdA family monooxygenase n=1 Tax=Streptomyces sp. HSG2 TaxID=2797167 RepID=UPI00190470D5|nr:SidA/IucD/PvdA family monooxygenase [Streptomyces sp. HSG2]